MPRKGATTESGLESMSEYLRRVGNDHAESGKDYTAQDYHMAADRIDHLEAELKQVMETWNGMNKS